jgi:hypothetical protein
LADAFYRPAHRITMLCTSAVMKPVPKPQIDFGIGFFGIPPPDVLSHEEDTILMELKR